MVVFRIYIYIYVCVCVHVCIIFVWRKHEITSKRTGSRVNSSYERIASCAGTQVRTRPQSPKATPPPTIGPNVLTTRSWPNRQKRIGTSCMVSHTRHISNPILDRNESPLEWIWIYEYIYVYINTISRKFHHFFTSFPDYPSFTI